MGFGTPSERRLRMMLVSVALVGAWLFSPGKIKAQDTVYGPPIDEYVKNAGPGAKIVPAGSLLINGKRISCGNRATVLDPGLDDFGAAYPNYLILNPKLMAKVPPTVRLWIHFHECGHEQKGPDEETADCFAIKRGRAQKWLTTEGLEEICAFIKPSRGDSMHFAGSHRCEAMRRCFTDPGPE